MDPLRIYVVADPLFKDRDAWLTFLIEQFDCVGMQRDGLRFSVPVHIRSQPWGREQHGLTSLELPRRIELQKAHRNLVLILYDPVMHHRMPVWGAFFQDVANQLQSREHDLVIPVQLGGNPPAFDPLIQTIRQAEAKPGARFMIRLLDSILRGRGAASTSPTHGGHPIFVSHAKRDGIDVACRIVELISKVNASLGPVCFFDADSIPPGDSYEKNFESAIRAGSLLAVVTDAYHTRPWCRWEVLTAKRLGRPVVAADLTDGRIERTFPYLGNVPSIRLKDERTESATISDESVERLTLSLLAETLRTEVWRQAAADHASAHDAHLCIRPPELTDLVLLHVNLPPEQNKLVLYPDPPLSTEETELLHEAFPRIAVRTLSQVLA